jgi:nitronate monooxygenase
MLMETRLTKLFGIKHPILSAPMANHSGGRLAGAVSAAGALGTFGAAGKPVEWLKGEIALARSQTDGPFGVGFITHRLEVDAALFYAALEERVPVIAFSFADPRPWIDRAREAGCKTVCQVQSMERAHEAVESGADVLAVQGVEAGGHTGATAMMPLLEQVLDAYPDVPVIASGGIGSGRAVAAVLAAGADGAWMGTRFLATDEAVEVSQAHKDVIVRSDGTDTAFTPIWDELLDSAWPQGIAGRGYANAFYREWEGRERELADRLPYVRQEWQKRRDADPIEQGAVWMGLSAAAVQSVLPAAQVIEDVMSEAERLLARWK